MKKLLIAIIVIILLMLLVASSVRFEKDNGNILIILSKPHKIVWPCEIDFVGEDAEKGFRIGPKVDQGWRNRKWDAGEDKTEAVKANGYATYNFYIPADGEYTLWGYTLWGDSCTNAVFVRIDQAKDTILGNDPIYKKWHWVRGISTYLIKGSHTLTLSNHSNDVALQKIMLIGSKYKLPGSCENYFTDVFYDDFDGCDLGNFKQWKKVSGKWFVSNYDKLTSSNNNSLISEPEVSSDCKIEVIGRDWENNAFDISEGDIGNSKQLSKVSSSGEVVSNAASASNIDNSLIGESVADSNCEIRVDGSMWENYSFDIDVSLKKWGQGASAQFRFGESDEGHSFAIKLTPSDRNQFKLFLIKNEDEEGFVLGECDVMKKEFTISMNMDMDKKMVLLLDGKVAIRTAAQSFRGGISIFLEGEMVACFDNLHIRYMGSFE